MDKLREAIAERIQESGLSIRALARTCSISEGNIRHYLSGRVKSPRIDTLEKICHACGTSLDAILSEQNRTIVKRRPRKKDDAKRGNNCAPTQNDALNNDAVKKPHSNIIYNYDGRLFPDECGDDVLLMCHALANTGHSYHGDNSDLQYRHAMEEDAEAEVRSLQERLEKAIAARDKLKGGGK